MATLWIWIAAGATLSAGCFGNGTYAGIDVRSQHVAGDELHAVVETYRMWRPLLSHSHKVDNVKAYYVVVDLAAKGPVAGRTKVFGPLWEGSNAQSALSLQAGANFTPDDVRAAESRPGWAFDERGALVRFARDPGRPILVRHELVTAADGASWRPRGDVKPIPDPTRPMSEDRVETTSGRFVLIHHDGKARLFDLFTGEERDDPWLTGIFAEARSIKDLENVRVYLTDDLNHLVIAPVGIWNDGRGTIHETFDYRGQTHRRAEVGLAFRRGAEGPTLFARGPVHEHDSFGLLPRDAIAIQGDPYLLTEDNGRLTLATPDGARRFEVGIPTGMDWRSIRFRSTQHDPARNELILFESGLDAFVGIVRWDYAKGVITRDEVSIPSAFRQQGGQFRPTSLLPIR